MYSVWLRACGEWILHFMNLALNEDLTQFRAGWIHGEYLCLLIYVTSSFECRVKEACWWHLVTQCILFWLSGAPNASCLLAFLWAFLAACHVSFACLVIFWFYGEYHHAGIHTCTIVSTWFVQRKPSWTADGNSWQKPLEPEWTLDSSSQFEPTNRLMMTILQQEP